MTLETVTLELHDGTAVSGVIGTENGHVLVDGSFFQLLITPESAKRVCERIIWLIDHDEWVARREKANGKR